MICYLFFQIKLSFLQHPFPDIKDGKILAPNIANIPNIEPPFCSFILLYLVNFNCFLITDGNLFNTLLILFTSDCDKFILQIDPPFFLFKALEMP